MTSLKFTYFFPPLSLLPYFYFRRVATTLAPPFLKQKQKHFILENFGEFWNLPINSQGNVELNLESSLSKFSTFYKGKAWHTVKEIPLHLLKIFHIFTTPPPLPTTTTVCFHQLASLALSWNLRPWPPLWWAHSRLRSLCSSPQSLCKA